MELPGRFTAKVLYGWDDRRFEKEYLDKLEKNWKRWKEDRKIDESEHLRKSWKNRWKRKTRKLGEETGEFLRRRNLKKGVM